MTRPQRIGAFTAACVLVSNSVGSGIFTTTGFLARDVGEASWILALWGTGAAIALAGALAYAELGAALPRSGGEYVYLTHAFGPRIGLLSGWASLVLGFGAAIAANAVAFAGFAAEVAPSIADAVGPRVFALALVVAATLAHAHGPTRSGAVQRALTWAKIGAITTLFGAAALALGDAAPPPSVSLRPTAWIPGRPTPGRLAVGLVFVLYAFSGWNAVAYISGEVDRRSRNLPRALGLGTLFVGVLYVGLNLVYLCALPIEALAAEPVLPVAEKVVKTLLGPEAGRVLSGTLCVSIAGATSAMVWVAPRVYREMAVDGWLPRALAREGKNGAPRAALALQAVWVSALVITGSFEQLVVLAGVPLAVFSGLTVTALAVLRLREPELERPFRSPLGVPGNLGVATAFFAIATSSAIERPIETGASFAIVASGLVVCQARRARGQRGGRRVHTASASPGSSAPRPRSTSRRTARIRTVGPRQT